MKEYRLGALESRFADIVWQNEPMTTKELCAACESELNWKRTTTYTVLKKLLPRGRIYGIAAPSPDLFRRGCPGFNMEQVLQSPAAGHILQNKLRHGTSANIAMANK